MGDKDIEENDEEFSEENANFNSPKESAMKVTNFEFSPGFGNFDKRVS